MNFNPISCTVASTQSYDNIRLKIIPTLRYIWNTSHYFLLPKRNFFLKYDQKKNFKAVKTALCFVLKETKDQKNQKKHSQNLETPFETIVVGSFSVLQQGSTEHGSWPFKFPKLTYRSTKWQLSITSTSSMWFFLFNYVLNSDWLF